MVKGRYQASIKSKEPNLPARQRAKKGDFASGKHSPFL